MQLFHYFYIADNNLKKILLNIVIDYFWVPPTVCSLFAIKKENI
jgi:hypothetical protein